METISVLISFPHFSVSCLIIIIVQCIVHSVFSVILYIYGYPITGLNKSIVSEHNVRSLPITGFQVYRSSGVPDGNIIIIMSSLRKSDNHE